MQNLCRKSISKKDIVKIRYLKEDFDEKALWKAVLCQAIDDATTESRKSRRQFAKRKAIKWLTEENEDFKIVCHLAGYSPKIVKQNVRELIASNRFNHHPVQLDIFEIK